MKTKKYLGIFFAATVIAACSNDRELDYSTASLPVNVTANLQSTESSTRATLIEEEDGTETETSAKAASFQNQNYFVENEEIAIYLEEVEPNDGQKVTTSVMGYATPAQYKAGAASGTQSLSLTTAQYFPTSGKNVKLYAFYPYSQFSSVTNRAGQTSHGFAVDADQSTIANYRKSDLMTASKLGTDGKGFRNEKAELTFTHKLAKVTIILKKNAGVSTDQLKNAVVQILNTKLKANLDMSSLELNETSTGSGNYTVESDNNAAAITVMKLDDGIAETTNASVTGSAIVVPQKVAANSDFITVKLTDTAGGGTFTYKAPDGGIALASGNEYTYTITITNQGLEVENTTINNWSGNSGSGNATL